MKKNPLGQHLLANKTAVGKIISALDLKNGDSIIEIGSGPGTLTLPLVKICGALACQITALEKDGALADKLRKEAGGARYAPEKNCLKVVTGDALKLLPAYALNLESYKLAGNIPYYITGRLLRTLSELGKKPALTVLTVQSQVAERILAKPPKMNLLSAITQFWAEPEILMRLKPADFAPPPEVDSTILKLAVKPETAGDKLQAAHYFKFVKIAFKQPRKTVFNNLRAGSLAPEHQIKAMLKKHRLSGNERPQDIGLEVLINLARDLS